MLRSLRSSRTSAPSLTRSAGSAVRPVRAPEAEITAALLALRKEQTAATLKLGPL